MSNHCAIIKYEIIIDIHQSKDSLDQPLRLPAVAATTVVAFIDRPCRFLHFIRRFVVRILSNFHLCWQARLRE
jgi:hypothetical protein